MSKPLQAHPFAELFPGLPDEELAQLAQDIKERGQLEPIILYRGLILDGRNRYRACQIAGVKPRLEEFDAKAVRRSPEEFVLSRNLRRRHLSMGQKAAIALDWSEQIELSLSPKKIRAAGRPKGALSQAAKYIGINEQRVFEVRQIRDANPRMYQQVKAGKRSLTSALAQINPPRDTSFQKSGFENDFGSDRQQQISVRIQPADGKAARGAQKPAGKESILPKPPSSPAAIEKALARIKVMLGNWFYAEVRARNLVQNSEEIVQFAKLTDAQMLEIAPLLKGGWTFVAAFREVVERLTPDDQIRSLHTRAVENGRQWYLSSVGNFGHVIVWGTEKEKTLAKVKEALARTGQPFSTRWS
jgi:hypothetical protein